MGMGVDFDIVWCVAVPRGECPGREGDPVDVAIAAIAYVHAHQDFARPALRKLHDLRLHDGIGGHVDDGSLFKVGDPELALLSAADILQHQYVRSEEHTSELQSLMRLSYAVFCLKKKITTITLSNTYE